MWPRSPAVARCYPVEHERAERPIDLCLVYAPTAEQLAALAVADVSDRLCEWRQRPRIEAASGWSCELRRVAEILIGRPMVEDAAPFAARGASRHVERRQVELAIAPIIEPLVKKCVERPRGGCSVVGAPQHWRMIINSESGVYQKEIAILESKPGAARAKQRLDQRGLSRAKQEKSRAASSAVGSCGHLIRRSLCACSSMSPSRCAASASLRIDA